MDVRVLLQARGGGERFAALGTGMRTGADMLRADVALEVAGIGEDLLAVLARVTTAVVVGDLVADEIRLPVEDFGTLVALVLAVGTARVLRAVRE